MTIIIDPKYRKLATLLASYWVYDKEKKEFIIPEDTPKEIHEAAKRKQELWENIRNIKNKKYI